MPKNNRVCKNCGKRFSATSSRILDGLAKYCSHKCFGEAHSKEKSPAWKGGITPDNKLMRASFKYRKWREYIFEKDNYECRICGKTKGKLNVHHKISFSSNKDLRIDKDNGVTLCVDCHNDYHKLNRNNETDYQTMQDFIY